MAVLDEELSLDPLGRGYAAMTNAQVILDMNAPYRPAPDLARLSASEIFEVIDRSDFQALTADQKTELQILLGLGDSINVGDPSKARSLLSALFGAGTATRSELLGLVGGQVQSRAQELGLGRVREADVEAIRGRV